MKSLKMAGAVIAAAAVLMALAFVGSASATTLTGAGGATLGAGTSISAANEGKVILHPPIGDIECESSSLSGKTENAGSSTETVFWFIEIWVIKVCNSTFVFIRTGTFQWHTSGESANNNALLTSTGAEFTIEFAGFHCIYKTNGTTIGTATGSANTGGNATIDISASIPRTGGRSGAFCGSTAAMTGSYKITSPSTLNTD